MTAPVQGTRPTSLPSAPLHAPAAAATEGCAGAPPSLPCDRVELDPSTPPAPTVRVSINAQDASVIPASELVLPKTEVGTNLSNSRLRTWSSTTIKPDANGNFLAAQGTPAFLATNAFAAADRALAMFQRELGHGVDWGFKHPLDINSQAGKGFNAFYNCIDGSLNFLGDVDKKTHQRIEAAASYEIVSHEMGHAVLDYLKPNNVGAWAPVEAGAFHEAFGDVAAMLTTTMDDHVVDLLTAQTGGDLHKDNLVAHLGELLSKGINDNTYNGAKPAGWTLRNANNKLTYVDPKTLPDSSSDMDRLTKEVHSFSRIWSGAMWDLWAALASQAQSQGAAPRDAIVQARTTMLSLATHGAELAPANIQRFSQLAGAVLKADQRYLGSANAALIKSVFAARKIAISAVGESGLKPGAALTTTKVPTNPTEALGWLASHRDQLTIPAELALDVQRVVTNERGETFVTYGATHEVPIGDRYATDLPSTFTVAFDRSGSIFDSLWEPVTDERIRLATETIEGCIGRDEIKGLDAVTGHAPFRPSATHPLPAGEVDLTPRQGLLADRIKLKRTPWVS